MNEDTNEVLLQVWNDEGYKDMLIALIGNEIRFIYALYIFIKRINSELTIENEIKMKNVNGNEIYIRFLELTENENEPHW